MKLPRAELWSAGAGDVGGCIQTVVSSIRSVCHHTAVHPTHTHMFTLPSSCPLIPLAGGEAAHEGEQHVSQGWGKPLAQGVVCRAADVRIYTGRERGRKEERGCEISSR